ncbi:DNA-binding protein [Alkalinema sp. FACHB-956]|uniref:DNA-binding protein n=1 Tax=Alkalinema sp. FACHB-956 TaxID=2692768 RepID=UPI001686C4BC|nr:DNA-binding protein [Alkalinema sp. FACHB-956]MBD2328487.1 DNA-binding protein [Alkalinema sp. FACHB-956]
MDKDLTSSPLERQNILNNRYALEKLQEHLGLGGTFYDGEWLFTKHQLVEIFGVSGSTIEKYLASHNAELSANGYIVLRGSKLRAFKALIGGTVIDYGTKTSILGVFNFRAMLNLAMVLVESDRARVIRSRILDIVLDVMAERVGGHTKYINQRDCDYLPAAYQEFNYRKEFTNALGDYVEMGKAKYGIYTNKVYQIVFREKAQEYRQILKLSNRENPRDTMYTEVLKAIASVENGLAAEIKAAAERLNRKLRPPEVDNICDEADNNPFLKPIIEDARIKMASRDLGFRDALHHQLEAYIQSVPESDFERFLGEASRSLEEQLSDPEILAVFKRLKDR